MKGCTLFTLPLSDRRNVRVCIVYVCLNVRDSLPNVIACTVTMDEFTCIDKNIILQFYIDVETLLLHLLCCNVIWNYHNEHL